MDKLYTCAVNFSKLFNNEYRFEVAKKTDIIAITLDFKEEDFHHLIGFKYLKDLDIPKKKKIAFTKVMDKKITYDFISSSKKFKNIKDSYADVESRVHCFQAIEEYLDTKNIIFKYIQNKNKYSSIRADFLIESTFNHETVYIFLTKRDEFDRNSNYVMCSFSKKIKLRIMVINSFGNTKKNMMYYTIQRQCFGRTLIRNKKNEYSHPYY